MSHDVSDRVLLATTIRAARAILGWSQTELGQRIGLSQRAIYKIESATVDVRASTANAFDELFRRMGLRFERSPDGGLKIEVPKQIVAANDADATDREPVLAVHS